MKSQSSSLVAPTPVGRLLAGYPPLLICLLLLSGPALAGNTPQDSRALPVKGPLVSELREPDPDHPGHVTVIRKYEDSQGNQVREFSVQGAIYQIQVIPVNAPAYYLIDPNGDGLFESMSNGHEPQFVVPQWVL
ncbi:MAG: DUF2782 domain-containing protein, partial [Magnetococcales bacterium]|nr:DUF2782 domain-containing protein [Magnetococcales bacterium]